MQERNGGVEGRFTYTEAGFNDYFNFPSSLRVNYNRIAIGLCNFGASKRLGEFVADVWRPVLIEY